MSAAETLQAAAEDLRFSWLRTLSQLIADLDAAIAGREGAPSPEAVLTRAGDLLVPPDADTPFGARYLRALQDHPEVVMAHRDVVMALTALRDTD